MTDGRQIAAIGKGTTDAALEPRDIEGADIPAVVELVRRCDATYSEWAGPWLPPSAAAETERWEALLTRPEGWARGVFAGGEAVGAVAWRCAEEESGAPIPGVAHVVSVFTDPAWWGRGIAAGLLGAAEVAMRERHYRVGRLWTPRDAPARGFYVRQGWTLDGRARWESKYALHLVGYEKQLG
jgi:GNAT superfamily N-acetyltransferase